MRPSESVSKVQVSASYALTHVPLRERMSPLSFSWRANDALGSSALVDASTLRMRSDRVTTSASENGDDSLRPSTV